VLAGVVGIAVVSMGAGFVAASRMSSPADEAARAQPPDAGPVTAAVERRTLTNQVVVRGDTVYDGAVEVRVETSGLATPAIVTGQPPAPGTTLEEGQVVLEVTGRPVIVLGGDIPTYRNLAPGSRGPDVAELEVALQRLGIAAGAVDDTYDADTSAGVAALFERAGYEPPAPAADVQQRLDAAAVAAAAAEDAVDAAEVALDAASEGPPQSVRLAADAAVDAAQRALDTATAEGDPVAIADATDQLDIAKAQRQEQLAPPDTSAEEAALEGAREERDEANAQLWDAAVAAATPLPAAEVVFVSALPRRVDTVAAVRGAALAGAAMTVSGATVVVRASLDAADRALVASGMPAKLGSGDAALDATVGDLVAGQNGSTTATITLDAPTPEQLESIRGRNVQVTIPIASTSGAVLCVPLAALSAGPGGESRVELVGADGTTNLVEVTVGLAAEGYAEITPAPTGPPLTEGDQVVVGR
jgi:hypothetical protein